MTRTGLACVLGLSAPLCAPLFITNASAQESAVQKELNRRINNARKAHDLLKSGDTAYQKKDYAAAVKDYSQAFDLLPAGAMTHQLRQVAAERYATAATERARKLAKTGDYEKARQLLDTVLKPSVAPAHMGALKLRGQIDDPIRYNHALTPAHVRDVQKVGRLLREAQGFYSLGQYDRALIVYQEVLRTDPYNKAARRGMETIHAAQSDYYRAARDQGRAAMLAEVDKNWELPIRPSQPGLPVGPGTGITGDEPLGPDLRQKLAGITVDLVALDNVSLEEAIDFVRAQSRLGDAPDAAGDKTGINILINLGDPNNEKVKAIRSLRVSLKARGLPLSKVLDYITEQTRTQWRTDGVSVLVTPLGTTDGTLVTRTFRVPPNFLSSAATEKAEDDNPFGGDEDADEGKIAKKISITDFLKQNGISFPDGATASYTASTNTLIVKNTAANIDLVDQLVSIIAGEEPVMVVVKTTIMRVSEEKLKELQFDWVLTPWAIGRNGLFLGGGTTGNGTPLGFIPQPPFTAINGRPVTSGNRSGNSAIPGDSIDAFLNASNSGAIIDSRRRAPGILTLSGVMNNVQVQMMMRGLNNQTGVDVMVKPFTISRSGERSKIEVIREFIYPTEYEPPEVPNTVGGTTFTDLNTGEQASSSPSTPITPAHPTAFETRNVGVTLEVEPTVGPNRRYIELSLKPEMVEFEGFVNYGTPINGASATNVQVNLGAIGTGNAFTTIGGTFGRLTDNRILMPVFKILRLQNQTLTIEDGATVVLGGLLTSRKTKVEDKTPLLGDIPIAGRLFRSNADRTFREAVIVMVSAELVDPSGAPWRNR